MKIYTITRIDDRLYSTFWKQFSDEFRNLLKQQFRSQLNYQLRNQLEIQLCHEIMEFQDAAQD